MAANLQPVVIELRRGAPADAGQAGGDELSTDVAAVEEAVRRLGAAAVACVATTTSCFAPRAPDDVRTPEIPPLPARAACASRRPLPAAMPC